MKERLRATMPRPVWDGIARVADNVQDAVATVADVAMRVLPADVRIELRRRLDQRERLDYPAANILMRVTSRAERRLRLRSCAKEPETVAWLERSLRDGDVFYDVGANVGAYSLVAASLSGRDVKVYAFEPGVRTFESLSENIAVNGLHDRVMAMPVALTDRTGIVRFEYASVEAGAARHPGVLTTTAGNVSGVLGYRLDELVAQFCLPRPTHIKIDVDGSELLVLRGAEATLGDPHLRTLIVETAPDSEVGRAVRSLLERKGFALVREVKRGQTEVNCEFVRDN